jgi:hypothetical protein
MRGSGLGLHKPKKFELLVSSALVLGGFLTRLPFRSPGIFAWDEVQFILGSRDFDITRGRPHPPGCTLYVGLLRVTAHLVPDDNLRLVLWATLAASASAVLLLLISLRLTGDRETAVLTSCVWATNPLLWYSSDAGSVYAMAALASTGVAYATLRFWQRPSEISAIMAGATFAFAAGLRQDQLLLLSPIWLLPALRSRACRRLFPLSAVVFTFAYLAWYFPTAAHGGGIKGYSHLVRSQFLEVAAGSSVLFGAPLLNHAWVVTRLAASLLVGAFPLWILGLIVSRNHRSNSMRYIVQNDSARFLGVWAAPSVLFFTFVGFAKMGYCLICLPAITAFLASAVIYVGRLKERGRFTVPALIAFAVTVNACYFLLAPRLAQSPRVASVRPRSGFRELSRRILNQTVLDPTYSQLKMQGEVARECTGEIRALAKPGSTAIILVSTTSPGLCSLNWRSLMYSFPQVPVIAVGDVPPGDNVRTNRIALQVAFEGRESAATIALNGARRVLALAGRRDVILVYPTSLEGELEVQPHSNRFIGLLPAGKNSVSRACSLFYAEGLDSLGLHSKAGQWSLIFQP